MVHNFEDRRKFLHDPSEIWLTLLKNTTLERSLVAEVPPLERAVKIRGNGKLKMVVYTAFLEIQQPRID